MMKKHLKYLSYLLRHRWFVFIECCKAGIPIKGLVHDLSKFRPSEYFPYANFFYHKKVRDKTGYYKPTDTGDVAFDFAWFLHQKRNAHHWQYWVIPTDEGKFKILDMPLKFRKEMLCDWKGAGRAQKTSGVRDWYLKNAHKLFLHPNTRNWIEERLNIGAKFRELKSKQNF